MSRPVSVNDAHLARIRDFYDAAPIESTAAGRFYRRLLAHYYRQLIPPGASVLEIGCGSGELLSLLPNRDVYGVDLSERQLARAKERVPHGVFVCAAGEHLSDEPALRRPFDYLVVSDTVSFAADAQTLLENLHAFATPETRLVLNFYSALWRPILAAATGLALKAPHPPASWLGRRDVRNLLRLASWDLVKEQMRILVPVPLGGLERLANTYLAPFLPWLCLTVYHVARPVAVGTAPAPTVSVVVPARNEAGNIEATVRRTPVMGGGTELIFVEGHSTDDTWGEIQRVIREHPDRRIRSLRQTGTGKANAVREGFEAADGDVLMILDGDLSTPPEDLPKFYRAIAAGQAELANGVRLVYPMDERAMQFLNMCANQLFSLAFSWILDQPIKDTLCGTKVLSRSDYRKIAANRAVFGDFDPFGDYDLIFGASRLNLKIVDIPIRYRERTYGRTNIRRWAHGWLLIKMVGFALRRLKFV